MTKPGIYIHAKTGNRYRVLHRARQSTNGPDEGKMVVVYLSLRFGTMHVRDEAQFHEKIVPSPTMEFNPGVLVPRFMFVSDNPEMADANAEDLYDSLRETFGGKS